MPWTTSRISGRPARPLPFRVDLAFPHLKFKNPKCVVEIPGSQRLLVAHDGGKLVSFPKGSDVDATSLVADLTKVEGNVVDANTVAFHPDFLTNRHIFVAMVHAGGGFHSRVMRYTLTDEAQPRIVSGSGRLIIRWPAGGHGGGCLQFGTDGYLYISTGDGSGPAPPDGLTTGQDIRDLLGAVLRIDVDHADDERGYSVPKDNPFLDLRDARPEIWSYGLRNPWKFGVDPQTGDIFVADNGWETWELIHKLHRGSNCGWPIMEGRARLRTEVKQGPTPITPPVKDHPHTEANSVIGGPVYRGRAFPDLDGTFVYGDYITGTVWGLKASGRDEVDHRTLADSDLHIVAFTEGSQGEIYLLDYDTTQQLYQLERSDEVDTSASFPRSLSETGLFGDTQRLLPASGVIPYEVSAEPWSDGASALRWVAIPGDGSIELRAGDPAALQYPNGTVLVKHLAIADPSSSRRRPLETQLLHYEDGSWNPYSYLWDDAGLDATLVRSEGIEKEIQWSQDPESMRTWRVGSTNECRLCHNAGSGFVLGFTARQLDRRIPGPTQPLDQLRHLTGLGVLASHPDVAPANKLVNPHDPAASLDDRARSYLHVNCGICHNKQGPATISFFAHRDYPFDELRITKRPGIGTFGMQSPQLVSPGKPYSSIILYRLAKLGFGRMPYVGSRVVDSQGVALIESWIKSLGRDESGVHVAGDVDEALTTTEGALALAATMHRGALPTSKTDRVRQAATRMNSDIRGLFDHFVPEADRRKTLGMNPSLAKILDLAGDRDRGELIFLSDHGRCKSCHHPVDAEQSLGPTLADIRKQYPRRNELLTHIVRPSEKIDEKYAAWAVVLDDGRTLTGMLAHQDDREVRVRTAEKEVVRINRDDVDEMQKSSRSLMPEGVLSDLTPQEAADLLSFLIPNAGGVHEPAP